MSRAFSFNREFDFVRLDGLRRATGRPPHEWDLYIIKELLDNALDADEVLWCSDKTQFPSAHIHIEYTSIPELRSQQLFIQVNNRAEFPVAQLESIFDPGWYTSRKAFIKGLTRGALGNALKTLLGIPYALRQHVAGDWNPFLKPLSIRCHKTEYLPRYVIDSLAQTVEVNYEIIERSNVSGTMISIGLDYFEQERPRTIEDIALLALQYHLCNPHAQFSWSVLINGHEWTKEYVPDNQWTNKFCAPAPIHWYEPTEFQDILGSLYHKQFGKKEDGEISLEHIYPFFALLDKASRQNIEQTFGKASITAADIEGAVAKNLYHILLRNSRRVDLLQSGRIGEDHIRMTITDALSVNGNVLYTYQASDDPAMPFVIEAATAYLEEGKRQLWTAINYTPTYSDPFQNRYLRTPLQEDDHVLGLRGFLDTYGMTEDTPILLFFHLVSPKIEHHDFSKTEINHLPFRQALSTVLNKLLTQVKQMRNEDELRLEENIQKIVEIIFREMDTNHRFEMDPFMEKVRQRLQDSNVYVQWLSKPNALVRLQTIVINYLGQNALLAQKIARNVKIENGLKTNYRHYNHQKCFVGLSYNVPWRDDITSVCEETLPMFGLQPWYADDQFEPTKSLRDKAVEMIANARYGLYDLSWWQQNAQSEWRMPRNVLIELGMAIALNRPLLLLRHGGNRMGGLPLPACLDSISQYIVEFTGSPTLKHTLEKHLPQWLDVPPERAWWTRYCLFGQRICTHRENYPLIAQHEQETIRCHIADGQDVDRPDFHSIIEDELGRYGNISFDYLDTLVPTMGYDFMLCTHCQTVRSTQFAIYRITPETTAETYIAIGISIALEKQFQCEIPKFIFTNDAQSVPSLLAGYEVFEAKTTKERRTRLHKFIPDITRKVQESSVWKPESLPFVDFIPTKRQQPE